LTRSFITDEAGQELGLIVILEDVTEKRKTEDQIQRISKLLSLGQLASGIAHEIRNPLSGITYVLDEIHDSLKGDDERRELLEKAIKEIDRVDWTVSSLLDFARVNKIAFSRHSVHALLEDALLWIRKQCEHQKITVIKNFAMDLPDIMMDPRKLKQAFLDLMINALDAMKSGGDILKIHTRGYSGKGRHGKEQSKFIEVVIEDSGCGIPARDHSRIFDPFFTTKPEGSGLGLAITHSIIMEHGGKIAVESEEQQGARFTLFLPTCHPGKGGIVTIGIESDIDVMDPHKHLGWMTYRIVRNVFEGLVCRDLSRDDVAYAPIIPGLAESFEVSSDNRVYSFHLRKGVNFHDNTPLDAEAIGFNIERMTCPEAPHYDKDAAKYSSFIWKYLEKVSVSNPLTIDIHLREPFSEFLAQLTEGGLGSARILSPSAWRKYGNEGIKDHPIGTGPFRFVERGKRGEIILERNYDYWGELPFLDKIIFKPMPEPAARIAALQTGEVDLIFVPPPDTIEILIKAGFRVVQGPVPHTWYLSLNMRSPKMRDVRVRKAIIMAIDREKIAKSLLRGTATPAHGLQAPGCPSYDPKFVDYPFDPDKARRLLSRAGYKNGFKMTLQTSTAGSGQLIPIQMAEWIKNDLARVGIECKLEFHEWIKYIDIWANGMKDGVEANQMSWGMSSDYWLEIVAHSHNYAPAGKNSGYYNNLKADKLLDDARGEYDEQKKVALYREVNVKIAQDAAYVPIVNDLAPIVMNPKVRGFVHAPSEWYDFTKVWIEE
jgi:peptide/nickel transport system substrate-binding protein